MTFSTSREALLGQLISLAEKRGFRGKISGEPSLPEVKATGVTREQILWLQVMLGDAEGAKSSLLAGADSDYHVKGISLKQLANAYGHKKIIKLLQEYDSSPKSTKKPSKS